MAIDYRKKTMRNADWKNLLYILQLFKARGEKQTQEAIRKNKYDIELRLVRHVNQAGDIQFRIKQYIKELEDKKLERVIELNEWRQRIIDVVGEKEINPHLNYSVDGDSLACLKNILIDVEARIKDESN